MSEKDEIELFHPSGAKWTITSSPWPVKLIEIPVDEFTEPDVVVREEDFPEERG